MRALVAVLGASAALAGVVAVLATNHLDVAIPAAGVAAACAAGLVAVGVMGDVRPPRSNYVPPIGDAYLLLRDSFRSGEIGRQRIVAAVSDLQREVGIVPPNPEAVERLCRQPTEEFVVWVEREVRRLEEVT